MVPFMLFTLLSSTASAGTEIIPRAPTKEDTSSSVTNSAPPQGIAEDKWPLLMVKPDKKGTYSLEGFDISKKYPGESLDGWTVSVSLKSDIEAKDIIPDRSDEYFNAISLRLSPPEDLVKDGLKSKSKAFTPHDSWNVKATRISLRQPENRTALAGDDGSCKTLLSESCISAWEEAAGKNWESDDAFTDGIPNECRLYYVGEENPAAQRYENWSESINDDSAKDIDWYKGSELQSVASKPADKGDKELLDYVSAYWDMVIIVWGYDSSKLEESDNKPAPKAKLVCTGALTNQTGGGGDNNQGGDEGKGTNDAQNIEAGLYAVAIAAIATFWLA